MSNYTRNAATALLDNQLVFGVDTITETVGGIEKTRVILGRDVLGKLVVDASDSRITSIESEIEQLQSDLLTFREFVDWETGNTAQYVVVRNFGISAENPNGFEVRLKGVDNADWSINPEITTSYANWRLYGAGPIEHWIKEIAHLYDPGRSYFYQGTIYTLAKSIFGVAPTAAQKMTVPSSIEAGNIYLS